MAEFELKPDTVLVPHWAGTGVQFNAHVYAPMSGVADRQFPGLERKVCALSPQLVRIFYNHNHHGDPSDQARQSKDQKDRWASLVKSARLAQKANATLNVTWQSIVVQGKDAQDIKQKRAQKVRQFADVLEKLVRDPDQPITNLKWVTIQNEPNTPPKPPAKPAPKPRLRQVTPENLGAVYTELHELLKAKGLRGQIGLMGGDLIEGSQDEESPYNHRAWFRYMSKNYADILDAYSVHIYWNYDAAHKFKHRLDDVQQVLKPLIKRPLYVTEYGVKGFDIKRPKNPNGVPAPGNFHVPNGDRTIPIGRTNVAAFQQAWFLIAAAQMQYAGVLKWDCYYGMYDKGPQAAYAIGQPGPKGWPLYPSYYILRLITMTTEPGWRVLELRTSTHHTQCVAAFGGDGELTLLGLDEDGQLQNGKSSRRSTYTFTGLPARKRFSLALWNKNGGGKIVFEPPVTTNVKGVASIEVPLNSVFALTTKALPPP